MFELCASILAANFACLEREVRAAESAGGGETFSTSTLWMATLCRLSPLALESSAPWAD